MFAMSCKINNNAPAKDNAAHINISIIEIYNNVKIFK